MSRKLRHPPPEPNPLLLFFFFLPVLIPNPTEGILPPEYTVHTLTDTQLDRSNKKGEDKS